MVLEMARESPHRTAECAEKTNMTQNENDATLCKQLATEINVSGFNFIVAEREPVIRR